MIKPITPAELDTRPYIFPDFVIQGFNIALARRSFFIGDIIKVTQEAVIEEILKLVPSDNKDEYYGTTRADIFTNKWLDIERVYEEAGWRVEYHKAPYFESTDSFWLFHTP